jgi:hypothetical protein
LTPRLRRWVDDVDAWYRDLYARGVRPPKPPRDAPWPRVSPEGRVLETVRFFGVDDPDGHRVSFVGAPGAG